MQSIRHINVSNFRNYEHLTLDIPESEGVFLSGPNGIGKTTILEALSLFSPGRGLRRAKYSDMVHATSPKHQWAVNISIDGGGIPVPFDMCNHYQQDKRTIIINGMPAKTHKEVGDFLRTIWVTPDMGRLFTDSASGRRRFLDRLIYAFDPHYLSIANQYDHYLKERSTLLKKGVFDDRWLAQIEDQMANAAVIIQTKRIDMLRSFFDYQLDQSALPRFGIKLVGDVEQKSDDVKESLIQSWKQSRKSDALSGGSHIGPHRSDIVVEHLDKKMVAPLCSTGEQKILLFALIISFIRALGNHLEKKEDSVLMLILFDDVIAHFDFHHRMLLFNEVRQFNALNYDHVSLQTWLTSADTEGMIWDGIHHVDLSKFVPVKEK